MVFARQGPMAQCLCCTSRSFGRRFFMSGREVLLEVWAGNTHLPQTWGLGKAEDAVWGLVPPGEAQNVFSAC